jgi:hypothetical protein
MTSMNFRFCAAGIASCLLVALTLIASSAPDSATAANDWKRCGRSTYGGLFIYARGVGCEKARRVANQGGAQLAECIDDGCEISGFRCKAHPNEIEGGTIVCSKELRRVRFSYGG